MIAIAFCGLMSAICALLLFHVGWRIRSSSSTIVLDFALSVAAFSATSVTMSAGWIMSDPSHIRVDVQIGAVMVGMLCASLSASIWAVLFKVKTVTLHRPPPSNGSVTVKDRSNFKGFELSDDKSLTQNDLQSE